MYVRPNSTQHLETHARVFRAEKIVKHPNFTSGKLDYDFALV